MNLLLFRIRVGGSSMAAGGALFHRATKIIDGVAEALAQIAQFTRTKK